MFLCDQDIQTALKDGNLEVEPLEDFQLGPTSIDLHLDRFLVKYISPIIELGRTIPEVEEVKIDPENGYTLQPKEFVLGSTLEQLYISPEIQGWIETKGDIARAGIQVHNCDGHIDPGFRGTVTLEITNHNTIPIVLYPRTLICQLFVARLSRKCLNPYSGKYLGQRKPSFYLPKRGNKE
jgi:dCTP deaminase